MSLFSKKNKKENLNQDPDYSNTTPPKEKPSGNLQPGYFKSIPDDPKDWDYNESAGDNPTQQELDDVKSINKTMRDGKWGKEW